MNAQRHMNSPINGPSGLDPQASRPMQKPLVEDRILGTQPVRQMIKSLSTVHLVPSAQKTGKSPGTLMDVDVRYVVPDFHYNRRLDILSLLGKNSILFYLLLPTTNYFRRSGNWTSHLRKAMAYRRLYASIAKNGLVHDPGDVFSTPWLFASSECICRIDGHHRSSIARHLGYDRIKTLVITPSDVLQLTELPEEYLKFVAGLNDPTVDLTRPPQ